MNKEQIRDLVKRLVIDCLNDSNIDFGLERLRNIKDYIGGCFIFGFIDNDFYKEIREYINSAYDDLSLYAFKGAADL